jgi:ATP-dependent RNA helicase DDX24/MAK5
LGAGFLELEEFDEAKFDIVGGDVLDMGEDEGKAGKDRGKKKKKKRKRKRGGDDQVLSGDVDSVVENEQEGAKDKKNAKGKRDRKNRDRKRKRGGDDQVLSGNVDSVVENEQEGEKDKKNAKGKRVRKKRKVKDSEKSGESGKDVVDDDNAEGDSTSRLLF